MRPVHKFWLCTGLTGRSCYGGMALLIPTAASVRTAITKSAATDCSAGLNSRGPGSDIRHPNRAHRTRALGHSGRRSNARAAWTVRRPCHCAYGMRTSSDRPPVGNRVNMWRRYATAARCMGMAAFFEIPQADEAAARIRPSMAGVQVEPSNSSLAH